MHLCNLQTDDLKAEVALLRTNLTVAYAKVECLTQELREEGKRVRTLKQEAEETQNRFDLRSLSEKYHSAISVTPRPIQDM